MRKLLGLAAAALALVLAGSASAARGPAVLGNVNVDLDHGLAFPQNKQNEPAITRDPVTGVLVAGANDEISLDPCPGTTAPLSSPCPFTPGRPISAYYRSTNGGQSWTGGYLPGFDTIGRLSGGDPALDYGPRRCSTGAFSYVCGAVVYYARPRRPVRRQDRRRAGDRVALLRRRR